MNVLILSANTFPFSPSGPAYVAGAALREGHNVEVFDCLFVKKPVQELEKVLARFTPDVVGISIRTVTGRIVDKTAEFGATHFDARILVKELVDTIKRVSDAAIVLGGPGFNYFGPQWLDYLALDYGIRGEAEFSFPQYLKKLEAHEDITDVPGCVYRKNNTIHRVPRELIEDLDATALPAYHLFNLTKYHRRKIMAAILTKRGCAFKCTFCPYSFLEGTRYRLKSPQRVVDEIEHIRETNKALQFQFCDNSFNVPKKHAEAVCNEIIARKRNIKWTTIDLKPIGITDELLKLFRASGCIYVNLAIETASEKMLKNMHRGYSTDQIRRALTCLSRSKIPFSVGLLLGAPGETPQTIAETFNLIDDYPQIKSIIVSIGVTLWTHRQQIIDIARKDGQLTDDKQLFEGVHYISPELPQSYMTGFITSLTKRKNVKFIQVNKPYASYGRER